MSEIISEHNYNRYLEDKFIEKKRCRCELYLYKILINHLDCDYYIVLVYIDTIQIIHVNKESKVDKVTDYKLNYNVSQTMIVAIDTYCNMFDNKKLWKNDKKKPSHRFYNGCNLYLEIEKFINEIIIEIIKTYNNF